MVHQSRQSTFIVGLPRLYEYFCVFGRTNYDMFVPCASGIHVPSLSDDDSFMSCIVDNWIEVDGAKALAESLKHVPQLQALSLSSMIPVRPQNVGVECSCEQLNVYNSSSLGVMTAYYGHQLSEIILGLPHMT